MGAHVTLKPDLAKALTKEDWEGIVIAIGLAMEDCGPYELQLWGEFAAIQYKVGRILGQD